MKHLYYKCPDDCDNPHCNWCQGGLAFCTVCKGGEASLTKECCGRPITGDEEKQIVGATLNYAQGRWLDLTDAVEYAEYNLACQGLRI